PDTFARIRLCGGRRGGQQLHFTVAVAAADRSDRQRAGATRVPCPTLRVAPLLGAQPAGGLKPRPAPPRPDQRLDRLGSEIFSTTSPVFRSPGPSRAMSACAMMPT